MQSSLRRVHRSVRLVVAAGVLAVAIASTGWAGAQDVTPRPTPPPLLCARPNLPAMTIRDVEAELPLEAEHLERNADVLVVITLDAESRLTNARIQSSPSTLLNAAALAAARASTFRTEIRDCRSLAADYLYTASFNMTVAVRPVQFGRLEAEISSHDTVQSAPDIAYVHAYLRNAERDSPDAQIRRDALIDALRAKLRGLGIPDAKVRPESPGSRNVVVTVDAVASAEKVAGSVLSLEVGVAEISFGLRNGDAAYHDALSRAVAKTKTRAQRVAAAHHLHVGAVKGVEEWPRSPSSHNPETNVGFAWDDVRGQLRHVDIPHVPVRAAVTVTYVLEP